MRFPDLREIDRAARRLSARMRPGRLKRRFARGLLPGEGDPGAVPVEVRETLRMELTQTSAGPVARLRHWLSRIVVGPWAAGTSAAQVALPDGARPDTTAIRAALGSYLHGLGPGHRVRLEVYARHGPDGAVEEAPAPGRRAPVRTASGPTPPRRTSRDRVGRRPRRPPC